jgi:predicted acylesterase/phospholipase RssA
LSGGGSRAAYQVGALRALIPYLRDPAHPVSVVVGSSIGAINGILLGVCLKDGIEQAIAELESLWREREFRNTFAGTPSQAFFRAIKMSVLQYMSPGPKASSASVFDPTPLMNRVDEVINRKGGLHSENRAPTLSAVAVMTTVEGTERKPLLFVSAHKKVDDEVMKGAAFETCYVDKLSAKHGFASAALPSVLPPVELDTDHGKVRLVDGGISINVPVDPAARLGAQKVIVVDISGRNWWLDHYGEAHDTRPKWEVESKVDTFCIRPPDTFVIRCQKPLGPLLKQSVSSSTRKFIAAVGPTWPVFQLLKQKMGEDIAYEVMSYVALDTDYLQGLMERGYNETIALLRDKTDVTFQKQLSYKAIADELVKA